MVDDVDRANDMAEADRAAGVDQVLAAAKAQRAAVVTDTQGQRCCVDCLKPIDARRLVAVPLAVACVECEAAAEQMNHRRKAWAM